MIKIQTVTFMKFPTFSTEVTDMSYCGAFNTNLTYIHCLGYLFVYNGPNREIVSVWVRKHNYTSSRMMILTISLVQVPRLTPRLVICTSQEQSYIARLLTNTPTYDKKK